MKEKITQKEIILCMLYLLGKGGSGVDLETLTVGCFKEFPTKFSMDKFPEYPRIDKASKRMGDYVKQGLVKLAGSSSYVLTRKGRQLARQSSYALGRMTKEGKLAVSFDVGEVKDQNMPSKEIEAEVFKLKRSNAFEKYQAANKSSITVMDFIEFLKIDVYANKSFFGRRLKRVETICRADKNLSNVLQYLKSKFGTNYREIKNSVQTV